MRAAATIRRPVPAAGAVWAVWTAALLLSACATGPAVAPTVSGRLSLQVAATGATPARGFHAAFELRGGAERGRLDLSTPLGPTLAVLHWAPGDVRLQGSDGERRFDSLEAMSTAVLGERLPLQALPDWLQGRPWPGAPSLPEAGGFGQLGWHLDVAARPEGVVVATRDAPPPRVTLRVRLSEPGT